MSPAATTTNANNTATASAPIAEITEGEDDIQLQKWLKEIERAEQLMDQLEAKTEKLDAKMDALLSSLNDNVKDDTTGTAPEDKEQER